MAESESNTIQGPQVIWRDAVGYEGKYEVNNCGRVRNARTLKVLRDHLHKDGYRTVMLWQAGKGRTIGVHKLVAAAFIGPCPEGHEVNHKDGVKARNVDTNLEYKTHIGNMIHARLEGLWSKPKLNEISVTLILELFALGYRPVRIARLIGMDPTSIRDIKKGATWAYIRRKSS